MNKHRRSRFINTNDDDQAELARLRLENNEHRLAIQAAEEILNEYEKAHQRDLGRIHRLHIQIILLRISIVVILALIMSGVFR